MTNNRAARSSLFSALRGEGNGRVVMMLEIPVRNLASGGEPYRLTRGDVAQHVLERRDPMRLADDEWMDRQAQHHACIDAFFIELVERRFRHSGIALRRKA